MDVRELKSFIHVARAGSFNRAAAELYIAQPALSRQIAKLEEEIGVPLFVRHGRGVRLTAAGARLLERAEIITQMVGETGEHVRASVDEERGYLAVGLPPTMGALIAPSSSAVSGRCFPAFHCISARDRAARYRNGCWTDGSTWPLCTTSLRSMRSTSFLFTVSR